MRAKYPTFDGFCADYHWRRLFDCARHPARCFFGSSPSLVTLNNTYGGTASVQWLMQMLAHLNESTTAGKMDAFQMETCARAITANYYHLKASELMLFFSRLAGGQYGKVFFGSADPMAITAALHDSFLPEREQAYQSRERAERMADLERQRQEAREQPPTDEQRKRVHDIIGRIYAKFGIKGGAQQQEGSRA